MLLIPGAALAAERQFDPLPQPLSNNAVASVREGKTQELFSFMGIGPEKKWDSITNQAFSLDTGTGRWTELRLVPGAGRIAALAAAVHGRVYVLGGYLVNRQGGEISVPDVSVYEPSRRRWYRAADLPVPVDDAVAGVYRDRYLYVVGGWSNTEAVSDVQIYDVVTEKWQKATPIPGRPVFGHAGSIVDDTIVYVDGAYKNPAGTPKYLPSDECWMGKISRKDVTQIQWSKLPTHPGHAHFRIAAAPSEKDRRIYFPGAPTIPTTSTGLDTMATLRSLLR
jgi:N-acetylneuraminic acid mutarotase